MNKYKECDFLEREIILAVFKKELSITEIAKKLNRDKSTISSTVTRMFKHQLLNKETEILKDARRCSISVNRKRVRIQKTNTFYLIYFALFMFPVISFFILSLMQKTYLLLVGSVLSVIPSLLYTLYQVYVKGDKIQVEKNPKEIKKEKVKNKEETSANMQDI